MSTANILSVVAPLVAVIGILIVVRLATAGRRELGIAGADGVRQAVRDADMEFAPGETTIGVDGRSALIADTSGSSVAIAYVVGDRTAARILRKGDVQGVDWSAMAGGDVALTIRLADFGCPELRARLAPGDAGRWHARLVSLAHETTVQHTD